MGRTRKTNEGLPKRVYAKHGAYWFSSPRIIVDPQDGRQKKWIKLGRLGTPRKQIEIALERLTGRNALEEGTMPFLCDHYKKAIKNRYSASTYDQYVKYLDLIAEDFYEFRIEDVRTSDCDKFLDHHFAVLNKNNSGKKVLRLMRNMFIHSASKFDVPEVNPIDNVDRSPYRTKTRKSLPTHAQIKDILNAGKWGAPVAGCVEVKELPTGRVFECIVNMAYLTFCRAKDIRLMKWSQIGGDYIRIQPAKTLNLNGKTIDIAITPTMQKYLDIARDMARDYGVKSEYIFVQPNGRPYSKSGFFGLWDRARKAAGITDDVQFADLRPLGATDAWRRKVPIDQIRIRLAHASEETTKKYLRDRGIEVSELDMLPPWNEEDIFSGSHGAK